MCRPTACFVIWPWESHLTTRALWRVLALTVYIHVSITLWLWKCWSPGVFCYATHEGRSISVSSKSFCVNKIPTTFRQTNGPPLPHVIWHFHSSFRRNKLGRPQYKASGRMCSSESFPGKGHLSCSQAMDIRVTQKVEDHCHPKWWYFTVYLNWPMWAIWKIEQ